MELFVKVQQESLVRAAPCIDCLIRITDNKEIIVIFTQHLHQFILRRIDILKLINHDIFQTLLPFQQNIRMCFENMYRHKDQIIVVKAEAFLLLIQITVKQDILYVFRFHVFPVKIRS